MTRFNPFSQTGRDLARRLWPLGLAAGLVVVLLLAWLKPFAAKAANQTESSANDHFLVGLELVVDGLSEPTIIASAGDERLFVGQRAGVIVVIDENGQLLPQPFLDIADRVGSTDNWEQGLLGLAFHPDYASNGYFYVNYTDLLGDSQISRFQVSAGDPNLANAGSEVTVLAVEQPTVIHNGGALVFGPDGYLYIGLGDGGWLGDPQNRAQDLESLFGKILRIAVSTGGAPPFYTIPSDNPFVATPGAADEIWALGLRNPWRLSFDRQSGDLYIGDVGNFQREEIDFEPTGSPGGFNYGWRCYEGNVIFNLDGCGPPDEYRFPIYDYGHNRGCAVTGGYVYRGSQYPIMNGYYLFADLCSGEFWSLHYDPAGGRWLPFWRGWAEVSVSTFGQAADGELYVADYTGGAIYHVTGAQNPNIIYAPLAYDSLVPTPTPIPPGPDLVVTDLTVVPDNPTAGQPASIVVTVQNQGIDAIPAGNNFFIDFYVDRVPGLYVPGDFYWGAQAAQFGPGESRTFSEDFTFTAGGHDLYVQVDTDNAVTESNEDNNILGPQPIMVEP